MAAIDAHVHLDRLVAADALDLVLLEHAQHLRLGGEVHVADLVEEQRAAVGQCSNLPFFWACAPVNEPFSWPNSSLSSRSFGIAAQFTSTNGPFGAGAEVV